MQDSFKEMPHGFTRRTFLKTTAATVAATTLPATLLAACGGQANTTTSSGPTQVTYTFLTFNDISQGQQAVQNAINATAAMKAKNLEIKLDPIDSASFDQKLKLRFASGQPYDAVFTASWINNFYNNVSQGNLLALDDLLTQYAPTLAASMPKEIFDAARVNGKLYAIPNQQLFPKYRGVILRKDLAQKYNIDLTKLHTFSDLTPVLAELKAKAPGIVPLYSDNTLGGVVYFPEVHGIDNVAPAVGVKIDDTSLHVFNYYDTPEYMQDAQLARQWYQAGYYVKDPQAPSDAQAAFRAGKFAMVIDQARPEEPGKFKATYGYDEVQALLMKPFLNTEAIVAGLVGIFRSSQHPDKTMQLLEILNTDPTVYNLICHGIAGRDYTLTDKNLGLIAVPSTTMYNPSTDWEFGNQFNGYYTVQSEAQAKVWDTSKQLNSQATRSVALGFGFDPTHVKTQIAQVTAAQNQYEAPIERGQVDPASAIPQYLTALKNAGIDDIIQEAQKQLTAWKAASGK